MAGLALPPGAWVPESADADGAFVRVETRAQPAAGANLKHAIGGQYFELLLALSVTLTTAAGGTSRTPEVIYFDQDGNRVIVAATDQGLAGGAAAPVYFSLSLATAYSSVATFYSCWLPGLFLQPGWAWQLDALSLAAGDQFSGIVTTTLYVPSGPPPGETATVALEPAVLLT